MYMHEILSVCTLIVYNSIMPDLITPVELPVPYRRLIANAFVEALRNNKWKKHERVYGEMADFQIHGAHTNLNDPSQTRDIVEEWLPFLIDSNNNIGMPKYAAIISRTVYNKARDELSKNGLLHSLDFVLKNKAGNPYRVDFGRSDYRVRRNQTTGRPITDSQNEALMLITTYLAVRDVATDLLHQFTEDVAQNEDYAKVMEMAKKLREQYDL